MFNWGAFTLFLFILMRISGFVLFNPLFARSGIPAMFQAGFIGLLSIAVYYAYGGSAAAPDSVIVFGFRLLLELLMGFAVGMVMRFFFYVADAGGEVVDSQMGLSMAKSYDPSTQSQISMTANLLNILMMLLFFAENGHITLLRLMLTSGEIVPFGSAYLGEDLAGKAVELFAECALLGLKLALPILGAELLGQVGMGILNKVIPQINVFVINIDLKILIGFAMLLFLITPISSYLLEVETVMLQELRQLLGLMRI